MKYFYIVLLAALAGPGIYAQNFDVNLQLRPRFEFRNGYKTLQGNGRDATSFVSQRSRLNASFKNEKIKVMLSLQNVRVWGDVPTLNTSDKNSIMLYQAYGEYFLDSKWSFKLGRQELSYDNQRILGKVDWAQQGRSHDTFLTTLRPDNTHQLDIGLTVNSDAENLTETPYTVGNYKNMQFLWYHIDFSQSQLSVLALNTGYEYDINDDRKVEFMQTVGAYYKYGYKKFSGEIGIYGQFGEQNDATVTAWNAGVDMSYKISNDWSMGIGAEYFSGTDMDDLSGDIKSFNPLFGTNHAFNGFMDYFYVGNHINTVGLTDVSGKISYKADKLKVALEPHIFWSAANILDSNAGKVNNYLGTEVDITAGYALYEGVNVSLGYSQMFGSGSMQVLKGGDHKKTHNWAWISVDFHPTLFSSSR